VKTAIARAALLLLAIAACSKPTSQVAPAGSTSSAPAASLAPAAASMAPSAVGSAAPPASASAPAAPSAPPPDFKTFAGTAAGAKALVTELAKPGVDAAALTKQLRPTLADYKAVFDAKAAANLDAVYSPEWERGSFVVSARPGQTEVRISSATVADLKANNDKAKEFPGGYAKVASHLVGNATIYRFRFVEPGQEQGMAYDGLVYVNAHWVLIPKPWRGLDDRH
jgi:hypothetical protein